MLKRCFLNLKHNSSSCNPGFTDAVNITTRNYVEQGAPYNNVLRENLTNTYKVQTPKILNMLQRKPALNKYNSDLWISCVNLLRGFGFEPTDCFLIFENEPQVLTLPPHQLTDTVNRWCRTPLGQDLVKMVLLNHPQLLFLPPIVVEKRIPLIHQFTKKPKSIAMLLLQCPNLMTEQWGQIQLKIDYLLQTMRVDKSEIIRSSALSHTLNHIALRHNLLLKCGLFKPLSQYEHKRTKSETLEFRNPPLKRILDNKDISFARKICKISVEEYNMFKDHFEEEFAKADDGEFISDSDSESDDT